MDMDVERQMLEELRSQTKLMRDANRTNAFALVWLVGGSLLIVVCMAFGDTFFGGRARAESRDSWRAARGLVDQGELTRGTEMIGKLMARNPRNYYGYRLMGLVEQQRGDLKASEANFARACELFPTEENEKNLAAIRKAREKGGTVRP